MKTLINILTYGFALVSLVASIYYSLITSDEFVLICGAVFVFICIIMNYVFKRMFHL